MKKQQIYLEHANITVNNIQDTIDFFQVAFPHFKVRGSGNGMREWVHLGDDHTYIAINQANETDKRAEKNYDKIGINHIGNERNELGRQRQLAGIGIPSGSEHPEMSRPNLALQQSGR